jgi:hypothetical protein
MNNVNYIHNRSFIECVFFLIYDHISRLVFQIEVSLFSSNEKILRHAINYYPYYKRNRIAHGNCKDSRYMDSMMYFVRQAVRPSLSCVIAPCVSHNALLKDNLICVIKSFGRRVV